MSLTLFSNQDSFLTEYLPPERRKLAQAFGFQGSVGFGLVGEGRKVLFVDGRYVEQAHREATFDELVNYHDTSPLAYVLAHGDPEAPVAIDASSFAAEETAQMRTALTAAGFKVGLDLAAARKDIALANAAKTKAFAARDADGFAARRERVLAEAKGRAIACFDPQSVCAYLGVRGFGAPNEPFFPLALVIGAGGEHTAIAPRRMIPALQPLLPNSVTLVPWSQLRAALATLEGAPTLVSPARTGAYFVRLLQRFARLAPVRFDPLMQARFEKTEAQLADAEAAQLTDAIALANAFHALSERFAAGARLSETEIGDLVTAHRRRQPGFIDLSFPPVVAADGNASRPHYQATPETAAMVDAGSLLLIDSGAHYDTGTTDITRTLAFKPARRDFVEHYTLVLRAHIALACARFPVGARGAQIDMIARGVMWEHGLDYAHGTGHGVGHLLSVHELPFRFHGNEGQERFSFAQVMSNEPGFYRSGQYGIRIENEIALEPAEDGWMGVRTLTKLPIFIKHVADLERLRPGERHWLGRFNDACLAALRPKVNPAVFGYLREMTSAA